MADEIQPPDAPTELTAQLAGANAIGRRNAARFDHTGWLSFAVTSTFALAVYLITLAPDLTLEDSGILSVGAMYAGVPFPGGYPVWTIYSWLFTIMLPFSNVAWRVAFGSAAATAVACGLIAFTISRVAKILLRDVPVFARLELVEQKLLRGVCGSVAGLLFGFSAVWSAAVIVEIWALGYLLFAALLFLFTRWFFRPARRRPLYAVFFLLGLLLTNSQELLVVLPALVCGMMLADGKLGRDAALVVLPLAAVVTSRNQWSVWILFPIQLNWPMLITFLTAMLIGGGLALKTRSIGTEWKAAILCGVFLLAGLAFYFYIPLASMTNPPVNWGYPRSVEGFFHSLSRGQFEKIHPTDELGTFARQLWEFALLTGREFGWLYSLTEPSGSKMASGDVGCVPLFPAVVACDAESAC
jgi:hypothetical protein